MHDFFDGLEPTASFSFFFNDEGKAKPVKDTKYILFEGDILPFILFGDELHSINNYCYTVSNSIFEKVSECQNDLMAHLEYPHDAGEWSSYEIEMELESELNRWDWLYRIVGTHLSILLHSFLEKTFKYIYKWYFEEQIISKSSRFYSKVKIYNFIYNVFGLDEDSFQNAFPNAYNILEQSRKLRNNFVHENLEGLDGEDDYIYSTKKFSPPFKLIEFFTEITLLLYNAEKVYKQSKKI